jgi:hypothetical protein
VTLFLLNVSNYEAHIWGAPAQLEQLGPFVFRRYEQWYNTSLDGDFGEQLSYIKRTHYEYLPSLSSNTETLQSRVVVPNPSWQLLEMKVGRHWYWHCTVALRHVPATVTRDALVCVRVCVTVTVQDHVRDRQAGGRPHSVVQHHGPAHAARGE